MIKQQARVVRVNGHRAYIEPVTEQSCSGCKSQGACTQQSGFSGWFSGSRQPFMVKNPVDARLGDTVIVGIEESSLLMAALIAYLWPLFALFATAFLCSWLTSTAALDGEWLVVCASMLALVGAVKFTPRFLERVHRFHREPVILSIVAG